MLVAPLFGELCLYYSRNGVARLDPNAINLTLLCAGLVLHKTPGAYLRAAKDAVAGCGGIILQFPIYGGIMGLMAGTGCEGSSNRWIV